MKTLSLLAHVAIDQKNFCEKNKGKQRRALLRRFLNSSQKVLYKQNLYRTWQFFLLVSILTDPQTFSSSEI